MMTGKSFNLTKTSTKLQAQKKQLPGSLQESCFFDVFSDATL